VDDWLLTVGLPEDHHARVRIRAVADFLLAEEERP
jgi:hypothetical protein